MILETGDIILTSKKSIIAVVMSWFQHDPVFWGHVLIAKDENTAWEAKFRLRESPIQNILDKKQYKILRKKDLTEEQKETMRQEAPKLLGSFYSVFRIFLQLLDQIFSTDWFTNLNDRKKSQVCSSYAAWIYYKSCNYEFNGVDWESCDPDDIEDDSIDFPDRWIVLGEKGIGSRSLRLKSRRRKIKIKRK